MRYTHLFFDLDHTLWDFETNARLTLEQLFETYTLNRYFTDFSHFMERYTPINLELWSQYQLRKIPKSTLKINRFYYTFVDAGFDDYTIAEKFARDFININPLKPNVIPYTFELLDYLKQRGYQMYIITNGFTETQHVKMKSSGLNPYFRKMFISEEIGVSKPHQRFFEHAIKSSNARKADSLVIGDSLVNDVKGARDFGLDQVYLNSLGEPHNELVFKEITSLKELIGWL